MNSYVCKKPITLSGRLFSCGEIIPSEYIIPERVQTLIRNGYITQINEEFTEDNIQKQEMKIPIIAGEETSEINIHSDEVVKALKIVQLNQEDAVKEIETVETKESLILIHTLSNKKAVQKAVEAKKSQLEEEDCQCQCHMNQSE